MSKTMYAPTKWAQTAEGLSVIFEVIDCKDPQIVFEDNKLVFEGKGGSSCSMYKNDIEFYDEINSEDCSWHKNGLNIECKVAKKKTGPFWPRLLKTNKKQHWLRVDFQKWKDEDDSSEEEKENDMGSPNLNEMMAQMGRGPGSLDPNAMQDLDDSEDDEDSDDESLPELQQVSNEENDTENAAGDTKPDETKKEEPEK